MNIKNLNIFNRELNNYILESRKSVLKNTSLGFEVSVFCKVLKWNYHFITLMPNCSNGNKPIDFLHKHKIDGEEISYLVSGELMTEFPNSEFHELYNKIGKFNRKSYMNIENLKQLIGIYYSNPFSEETIDKMIILNHLMENDYQDNEIAKFNRLYYQFYEAVEMARRAKLDALRIEINKEKKLQLFDK